MLSLLISIAVAIVYGIASVYVVKQGGKYAKERGSSYKRGMIFPAFIMAVPVIVVIAIMLYSK